MRIRVVVVIAFFLFALSGISQKSDFRINGFINGLDKGAIELVDLIGDYSIQLKSRKVEIINGRFLFTGNIPYTFKAKFRLNDSIFTEPLFIDQGFQNVYLYYDSLKNSNVNSTSASNIEFISIYKKKMENINTRIDSWDSSYTLLSDSFHQKIPLNIENKMQLELQQLIAEKDTSILNYVVEHPKSEVALWQLYYKAYYDDFKPMYKTIFENFDGQLKNSRRGLDLKRILELGKKVVIGELFPKLTIVDHSGRKTQFKPGVANRFTLIDIWFSSCGPCLSQFNDLKAIYKTYKRNDFEIIAISVDLNEKKNDWLNTISKYELKWPQYWDVNGLEIKKLNIHSFPMNFLLDKNGKIIKKDLSPKEVEEYLKLVLTDN